MPKISNKKFLIKVLNLPQTNPSPNEKKYSDTKRVYVEGYFKKSSSDP